MEKEENLFIPQIELQLKQLILEAIKSLGVEVLADEVRLEHPANPDYGDYASNIAMLLWSKLKTQNSNLKSKSQILKLSGIKKPLDLAGLIKEELLKIINLKSSIINQIQVAAPGFINFFLDKDYFVKQANELLAIEEFMRRMTKVGSGKAMVIDYSAPNIAKPFGIGHLRSTNIGQAIYNLYHLLGWRTIGDNHLGDWGTQFGKLIYQIDLKSKILNLKSEDQKSEFLQSLTIADLEKLYVEFHQEAEKNPKLEEEARAWFKKLEEGDSKAKEIWQYCIEISLKEFDRVYQTLGIEIDHAYGESFYHFGGWMSKVLDDVKAKDLLRESQGALVIEIQGEKIPAMLVKSDGATTYLLRDLATIKFRMIEWHPDLIVYEVGADQKLYFRQVFKLAEMLDYLPAKNLVHLAHGLIRWPHGKFSTRKGKTTHLEEILSEGINRAKKLIESSQTAKDLTEEEKEAVAFSVGIGGVKFNDLKQELKQDIVFDWEKILSIEGYSGPYLQYTYARCASVLRKAAKTTSYGFPPAIPTRREALRVGRITNYELNSEELALLRTFYQFEEILLVSAKHFSPHILCQYLFNLAQKFNLFYQKNRILSLKPKTESQKWGDEVQNFRLALAKVTANIIKIGLEVLGIGVLEKM